MQMNNMRPAAQEPWHTLDSNHVVDRVDIMPQSALDLLHLPCSDSDQRTAFVQCMVVQLGVFQPCLHVKT